MKEGLLLSLLLLGIPWAGGAAPQLSYRDVLLGPHHQRKLAQMDGCPGVTVQQQPPHNGVHSLGGAPGGMLGDSSDLDDSGPSSGGANGRSSRGSERGRRYAAGERGRGVAAAMKQRSSSRGGGGEAYRAKAGHIPQQDKAVEGDSSVRVWNEWRQQIEDVIDEGRWRVAGRRGRSLTLSPEAWGELSPYVLRVALLGGKLPKDERRERRQLLRWARPLVAHLQQSLARANATYGVPPKWRGGERGKPWVAGRVGRGNWAGGRAAPKGEGEEDRGRSAARNVLERMSPTPSIHGIYIGEGEGDLVEPREELEEARDGAAASEDSGFDSAAGACYDEKRGADEPMGVKTSAVAGRRKKQQWLSFSFSWLESLRRDVLKTSRLFGPPQSLPFALHLPTAPLLPPPVASQQKRTLVIDLDETLIHTALDAAEQGWETNRRPGACQFLAAVSDLYEVVIFTAGMESYAGPVIDELEADSGVRVAHRLYRDSCAIIKGGERPLHVKDLTLLGRDLARTMIVDNSPESYMLQPENAIPIKPFFGDESDAEMQALTAFLKDVVEGDVPDVRVMLARCHVRGRFRVRSRDRREVQGQDGSASVCTAADETLHEVLVSGGPSEAQWGDAEMRGSPPPAGGGPRLLQPWEDESRLSPGLAGKAGGGARGGSQPAEEEAQDRMSPGPSSSRRSPPTAVDASRMSPGLEGGARRKGGGTYAAAVQFGGEGPPSSSL